MIPPYTEAVPATRQHGLADPVPILSVLADPFRHLVFTLFFNGAEHISSPRVEKQNISTVPSATGDN